MLSSNIYPILNLIPSLKKTLTFNNICIISAPPGAGKTTIVPPSLLDEPWLSNKKIIMLEPRRLAARRSAEYMSNMRSEKCGETIGYRIKTEAVISHKTRIEVVTEGILTRMLQSDMELHEAGLVIFDEFHERSIHADTGLAFLLDIQKSIRQDLKILIMSATPDINRLSVMLNNPPVLTTEGRTYSVATHYLQKSSDKPVEVKTVDSILSALKKEEGDILVFLPGKKEIKRTGTLLYEKYHDKENIRIHELYGDSPKSKQDAALNTDPENKRKIILSTSLAETSLTIDGIRIVIDSGLARQPVFNLRRGMPGLVTVPVSKASADQRRGRAGRQEPGICYRLWTKEDESKHPDFSTPEILSTDLTQFALELVKWGTPEAEGLLFIDPPPAAHLNNALSTLRMLGAIDKKNQLTSFGRQISELPIHPRLSSMILKSVRVNSVYSACLLAAVLEERELTRSNSNITHLISSVSEKTSAGKRIYDQAERLFKLTGVKKKEILTENTGKLLAFAYPDRLAKKQNGRQYQLISGTAGMLSENSSLINEEFLIVVEIEASEAIAKIFLAAAITRQHVMEIFDSLLVEEKEVLWDNDVIRGILNLKIGALTIQQKQVNPSEHECLKVITEYIQKEGLKVLPWSKEAVSLRERSEWFRNHTLNNQQWPELTDDRLISELSVWLLPFLSGIRKKKELDLLKMDQIIRYMFTPEQIAFMDAEIPDAIKVPGGSKVKLAYNLGEKPVLAVRLQELFGQTETPRINNGKTPVLIHLLSPAMRPLAITQDLKSFWDNVYPELLKQMRIKYSKHIWPDDPLLAKPTNKTKRSRK